MTQLTILRGALLRFATGMRARSRDILLAAAPAIAIATVVRVLTPFLFRFLLASGKSIAELNRQVIAIDVILNFLVLLAAVFAIAAFLHIARSGLNTQRAYERLSPVGFALVRLTLILGTIWVVAIGSQFWAGSRHFLEFAGTGLARAASGLLSFTCVSIFAALLLSIAAVTDGESGAISALRSACRMLPRTLPGCALLVLLFDIAADALVAWIVRAANVYAAHFHNGTSAHQLLALLAYLAVQIIRYLGFYALVCLYLAAVKKPERLAPAPL